jgi:hypothetical protein
VLEVGVLVHNVNCFRDWVEQVEKPTLRQLKRGEAALGQTRYLDGFTRRVKGENFLNWFEVNGGTLISGQDLLDASKSGQSLGDFFAFAFPTAMNNARKIHFNLKGILPNLDEAIRRGARRSGWTNRELYLILHNRNWYDKTVFYDEVSNVLPVSFLGDP